MRPPQLISDTKPSASHTAEVHIALAGTVNEAPSKRIGLPRQVQLVALKITLSPNGVPGVGLRRPTLDDVMVRIESQDLPLTRTDDSDESVGYDKYVTASALDLSNRYIFADLGRVPDITVQVRWKNVDNTVPIFEDTIVSVAALYNYGEG